MILFIDTLKGTRTFDEIKKLMAFWEEHTNKTKEFQQHVQGLSNQTSEMINQIKGNKKDLNDKLGN